MFQCKILRSFTRLSCFISAGTGFGSHLVKCRILSFTPRLVAAKKAEKRVLWHWPNNNVAFCLLLPDLLLQKRQRKKVLWHWPNNKIYALAKTLICLKPLRVHLSGKSLQLDGWVVILAPASHQSTPYLPGFVPPNLSPFTFVTLKLPTPQNTHFRSPSFWRNDFIFHNLNENWPCIYPLPLAHLFPITFRHSNIETEFHIKVTSTAERFIHERNIAAQAYLLSLWLWRSINVGIVYGGVCH